jgi:transposase
MCGSGVRWCARADAIFDVPDMHVLTVEIDNQHRLVLTIESGQLEAACPACGVMAVGHGRRVRILHDAPCLGARHDLAVAGADVALPRAAVSNDNIH